MKVGTLFDLLNSADGLLDLFENVETAEQAVSRCERLKRGQYPEALLDCLYDLRSASEAMRSDTLEMHSPPTDLDDLVDEESEDEEEKDVTGDPDLDALMSDESLPGSPPAPVSPTTEAVVTETSSETNQD